MPQTRRQFTRRFGRRRAVILAPLVIAMLVLPALTLALRSRLPAQAALSADPDDRLSWPILNAVTAAWLLVGTVALAAWLHRHRLSPVGVRWPAPFTWAAGAAACVRSLSLVTGNLDDARPQAFHPAWWAHPAAIAVIAAVSGAVGWVLAGGDPDLPTATVRPGPEAPRITLAPHQRTAWCRSVVSHRTFAVAGVLAGLGLLGVFTMPGIAGVLTVILAALLASHATVTVRVDQRGVTLAQSIPRRALIMVPFHHIEHATAAPSPAGLPRGAYGVVADGTVFGYRSRASGPALRLTLSGGRECVFTVEDPETAAALINTRLDDLPVPGSTRGASC
ncbi:hypothetical protein [Actinomadura litoris]|uniref:DUF1648 domain-containing protein n=1 Tax=Actinomadura litoris TaxID=2678616 RepID=A0A7K1L3E4_9ACTN|nr:hypothetical protein [Actinomadura litoris]MUN38907.1 hypothetical protein [Actinomadura litoris]